MTSVLIHKLLSYLKPLSFNGLGLWYDLKITRDAWNASSLPILTFNIVESNLCTFRNIRFITSNIMSTVEAVISDPK